MTDSTENLLDSADVPEAVVQHILRLEGRLSDMSDGIRLMVDAMTKAMLTIEDEETQQQVWKLVADVLVATVADTLAKEVTKGLHDMDLLKQGLTTTTPD